MRGCGWTRRSVVVVAVGLGLSGVWACSSDDGESSSKTNAEGSRYCEEASSYKEATSNVDASTVASTLDGLSASAAAARAFADVAPSEVRESHDRLASAAEDLVAGLRANPPASLHDLESAGAELTAQLKAEYGDLESETEQVQRFAERQCGVSLG